MPGKLSRRDDLGIALTFLRRIRGWGQVQLASASGVSANGIRALEQGRRRHPSFRTLGPITAALGTNLDALDELVALIRSLRDGGPANPTPDGAAFTSAPALRRELAALVAARCHLRADGSAPAAPGAAPRGAAVPQRSARMFGLALAFLRWVRGRAQTELAAATGVTLATILDLEAGERERSTPETLGRIETALGVAGTTLEEVAARFERLHREMTAAAGSAAPFGAAQGVRREIGSLIRAEGGSEASSPVPPPREVLARRRSWEKLATRDGDPGRGAPASPPVDVESAELCELLCEQSLAAAGDSAGRARRLAELAVAVAEMMSGPDDLRSRLRGYAGVHVANARRIAGDDLPAAADAFARSRELWESGTGADRELLNAARVLGLGASLRRAQRRVPEALALLDRALAIDRWGETPTLLLAKARALFELGDHSNSIIALQGAMPLIDRESAPRQRLIAFELLVDNFCLMGRYTAAAEGFPELQTLGRKLGNRLDLMRLRWLEGKVMAGLGRSEEAIVALADVKTRFEALGSSYDVALVTVELARVLAGLGRHAEVQRLARESVPIFHDQGVHVEAQRALELFCEAAEEERTSAELLHSLLAYLYRARNDSQLRFEAAFWPNG